MLIPGLFHPNISGVGLKSLYFWVFQTQGLDLSLLHCKQILCHLSHQGSPISSQEVQMQPLSLGPPKGSPIRAAASFPLPTPDP